MSRICRWRYTPGCENATSGSIASSDTCLDSFTCTCVKLGNCLSACALEECFNGCQPWSHWSATCAFVFHGNPVHRNRSRICKCELQDSTYPQININSTCWQYSTCETKWELYRFLLFLFTCVVVIKLAVAVGTGLIAFFAPSPAEQHVPGFNLHPVDTTIGLAEDVSIAEDEERLKETVERGGNEEEKWEQKSKCDVSFLAIE
ncbi:conserved hypothetical protein [Echinococcus multilocularis]|uniref:Uncharacterized protein n=1 Tax=Echinococcus multilocularis TaxID=6211 RepID=A0A068YAU9_ECHMU|nr:conserved hypothetical protein [Echinococcus multilocularis]